MNEELQNALSRILDEKGKTATRSTLLEQAKIEMARFDSIAAETIKSLNQHDLVKRSGLQFSLTEETSTSKPKVASAFSLRERPSKKWGSALRVEGRIETGSKKTAFIQADIGWKEQGPNLRVHFYLGYPDVVTLSHSYELYEMHRVAHGSSAHGESINRDTPNRGKWHSSLIYEPALDVVPLRWREQGQPEQSPMTLAEVIEKTAGQLS